MAGKTMRNAINSGYFSTGNVCELIKTSRAHVTRLCNRGELETYTLFNSRERRISSISLKKFLEGINHPVPIEVESAARNLTLKTNDAKAIRKEISEEEEELAAAKDSFPPLPLPKLPPPTAN